MKKLQYTGLSPSYCLYVGHMSHGDMVEVEDGKADVLLRGLFREVVNKPKTNNKEKKK